MRASAPGLGAPPQSARSALLVAAEQVKRDTQRIIDLNLQNIMSADGEIRHDATRSRIMMIALLVSGVLLAVLVMALLSRTLLGSLRTLTRSVREIEHGNLDLVVAVTTNDEIGQLAEAFNAMAMQLRRTQRSEQEKIIRAQRTTLLALDSLPDAVATITSDGLVDLANQTAQRLFRLRPGVALETLDSPRLVAAWRQVVASGQSACSRTASIPPSRCSMATSASSCPMPCRSRTSMARRSASPWCWLTSPASAGWTR